MNKQREVSFFEICLNFNFELVPVFTILSRQGVDDFNNLYRWMTYNQGQKVIISLPDNNIFVLHVNLIPFLSIINASDLFFHSQRDMIMPTKMLRDDETWWFICNNAEGWRNMMTLHQCWGMIIYEISHHHPSIFI